MILASFFDLNNNGIDVGDVGALIGVITALALAGRWLVSILVNQMHDMVVKELDKATHPIQPNANGGLSLPDVARETHKNTLITQAIAEYLGIDMKEK